MTGALLLVLLLVAPASACAQILITEIMFDPVRDHGCEYLELFNPTTARISLGNWRIVDATAKAQATLPRICSIEPGAYLVVAADSLIFTQFPWLVDSPNVRVLGRASLGLNATGDHVELTDSRRVVIDSLTYDDAWHRPDLDDRSGTSLERASLSAPASDARNWTSSVGRSGGTPGAENSIALGPSVAAASISIEPRTVSPDADGIDDVARISYRLPARTARINFTLHDRQGRLLARIINDELAASSGEIVWDAYDASGMPLTPGIYILRIEAYDATGIGLIVASTGVVVARR
jgi:hypothetical protein